MQSELAIENLRTRARGGWAAVLLTGIVVAGAVPFVAGAFDRAAAAEPGNLQTLMSGSSRVSRLAGLQGGSPLAIYWLVAISTLYALLSLWFALRARRQGLAHRWAVYIGIGTTALTVLALSALPQADPIGRDIRLLITPLLVLTAALVVLGVVEGDRRLVWLGGLSAIASLAIALQPRYGGATVPDSWTGEPLLSAFTSPQGQLAVLAVVLVTCGLRWRRA